MLIVDAGSQIEKWRHMKHFLLRLAAGPCAPCLTRIHVHRHLREYRDFSHTCYIVLDTYIKVSMPSNFPVRSHFMSSAAESSAIISFYESQYVRSSSSDADLSDTNHLEFYPLTSP